MYSDTSPYKVSKYSLVVRTLIPMSAKLIFSLLSCSSSSSRFMPENPTLLRFDFSPRQFPGKLPALDSNVMDMMAVED